MMNLIENFLLNTIRSGTPIMFALIGDLIGQRAGHISLSVEGAMLTGCCVGFAACYYTDNLLLAVLLAALAGAFVGFLQIHFNISCGADMFALALAINYFCSAVTNYFGASLISKSISGFDRIAIPLLSEIPLIGDAIFNQDILTYISYLLPIVVGFILFKTKIGTAIRTAGEVHQVAVAYGYNVRLLKYGAVMTAGILAAVGGVQLSCAYTMTWTADMAGGRGFIASALVILCSWKPGRAYMAAYLFGAAQSLQILFQLLAIPIPTNIVTMAPYVVTLIALAFISMNKNPSMPEELKKIGRPLEIQN